MPQDSPITQLLSSGESQTLEFKASFDKSTIVALVAFANTKGGTVLVGVADAGEIRGVTLGKETLNEWLGQIKSATSPSLIPDLVAHPLNGKTVVAIQVAEFPVKPVSTRGRYYKRIASSNHALAVNEIADLYLQSLQISWDAHPAPLASLDDLSPAKIDRFIRQINDNGRFALGGSTPQAALEKLNYISMISLHGPPCCCLPPSPCATTSISVVSKHPAPSSTTGNSPTHSSKLSSSR